MTKGSSAKPSRRGAYGKHSQNTKKTSGPRGTDYGEWSQTELIREIKKLKERKKYGLVWEDKPEDVVEMCSQKLPAITEIKNRRVGNDPIQSPNILIEGDNYHALSVLNYTHKGKVDVIYIDPPYNNGKKSWKYNNDYVDKNDAYKHSKWLSFMKKRLILAKSLLTKNGILMCAVDHNEQERLGLLLDEIFSNKEKVCVTIINNPSGQQGKNFSYIHDYVYYLYPKNRLSINYEDRSNDPDVRMLRDVTGDDSLRTSAKNCFYPIIIKDEEIVGFGEVCSDSFHPQSANLRLEDGYIEVYPVDPENVERKWRYSRETVEQIRDELKPKYIKKRKMWDIERTKTQFRHRTVWTDKKFNSNNYGTQLLNTIIDTTFPYPKSIHTVKECIRSCIHSKKNAIILDFFAGSGTTGHVILELNREDGGNRKFILCTNNENNICVGVCYPRIKKVIKGYKSSKGKKIEGLGGNLKYFKTTFVDSEPTDWNKKKLADRSTEMLCLKEGCFRRIKTSKMYSIFEDHEQKRMGVIYDDDGIAPFKKQARLIGGKFIVYVFSLDNSAMEEEFDDMDTVELRPIPTEILNTYRMILK